jgi:cysteine desulfuration protein SufE
MSIQVKIDELLSKFNQYEGWEAKYKELIQFGKTLDPLSDENKVEKFRIKGCQSQVWLVPELKEDRVYFKADSDALIVKGIIGLLIYVYGGEHPNEIISHKDDFLKEIGITDHLSMNRTNGLANMFKQIKLYAIAYEQLLKS